MLAATVNNATAWWSVGISWGLTAGVLGGYTALVLKRGKQASARVPQDKRRWM